MKQNSFIHKDFICQYNKQTFSLSHFSGYLSYYYKIIIIIIKQNYLLLFVEGHRDIGFKKPTVVELKSATSPAFRVGWHALWIRVNAKLHLNHLQIIYPF